MKKIALLLFILSTSHIFITAETSETSILYHISHDMNTFSTFFPLTENSPGEKKTVSFIRSRLDSLKVNYTVYPLDNSENSYSDSVIIDAVFQGTANGEMFLVIPLNTDMESKKKTFSLSLASALLLAEDLNKKKLSNRVHLVFMGGEKGTGKEYPIGTKIYLDTISPTQQSAFFYFDIRGIPDKINLRSSGTGERAPLWLVKKSVDSLETADIPFQAQRGESLIYKLKLNDYSTPLDPYLKNGYPAVLFQSTAASSKWNNASITHYYNLLWNITTDRNLGILSNENRDRHFLMLHHGSSVFFLSEKNYLLFILLLFGLMLLYPFLSPGRFKKYTHILSSHFLVVPMLFIFTFLFLLVATYGVSSLLSLRIFPELWKQTPLVFIMFKLFFSTFLFLLMARFFKFLKVVHKGSFYSASAMIFIVIDIVLLFLVDISFARYLVPVLITIFLFTVVRNKWIKTVFLLLSILLLIDGLKVVFTLPSYKAIRILLLSPLYGNLIITANFLPILLMIYRLRFLFHHTKTSRSKIRMLILDISTGLATGVIYIYLLTFSPFTNDNPQPVNVTENINLDTGIRLVKLDSPAPLDSFVYKDSLTKNKYTRGRKEISIQTGLPVKKPEISIIQKPFLNRTNYTLYYIDKRNPSHINVKLISDKQIILYDSNFPHMRNNDSTEITFITGAYPGNNFHLTFTVPKSFNGEILITGEYTNPDNPISVQSTTNSHYFNITRLQYVKKKVLVTNLIDSSQSFN